MSATSLTITSKNYGAWSLRGWLLCKFAGLEFTEELVSATDPDTRAELLLLSPSFKVPCLRHNGIKVWDTLAIAEYLHEVFPQAGLFPADLAARAHCRAINGEMHSGFRNLRSALPMNLKGQFSDFKIWSGAKPDIERIVTIWRDCLTTYGGPFLFGKFSVADAMYAPVVTRFITYGVELDAPCQAYCQQIMALPHMQEWLAAAALEPDDVTELEVEF